MNKTIRCLMFMPSLMLGGNAHAGGLPVVDMAALTQSANSWTQQFTAMANQLKEMQQQYQMMQQQYQQLQQTYNSVSGIRGMGDIANNPALRRYLPNDYQQALQLGTGMANGQYDGLSGSVDAMKQASKIMDIQDTGLDPNSQAGKAYQNAQNQAALNRVLAEESFKQSGDRIAGLQQMLDKVNQSPDDKDIQDLQARIQAEQTLLQNDMIRVASLAQLQQSQRDIANQQAIELRMQSTKGTLPERW